MNLNANLPLDCHEFAHSRFANSRNDKIPCHTNLSLLYFAISCHPEALAEVSTNLKCEFAPLKRGFFAF